MRIALFVVLALLFPAAASAQRAASPQQVWDPNGDPVLVGNGSPEGKGKISWRICPPGKRCRPTGGHGVALKPGKTRAGTRFQIVIDYRGRRTHARSRLWLGRLHPVAPPALEGEPVVGNVVSPRAATFAGGWKETKQSDDLRIEICKTPPTDCKTLASKMAIPDWAAGRYLQVLDRRYASDAIFPTGSLRGRPLKRTPEVAVSAPVLISAGAAFPVRR